MILLNFLFVILRRNSAELSLYKGNIIIQGRKSEKNSLYNAKLATFDDDKGDYDHKDAEGFIALNALRLKNRPKN